ncbi:histone-lysine N-methyltransferase SETDB1-B-like [Leuresthes tenuis]|uniref:histone-lysine N-methyltransferase SETDB1-B-like n=1 Tax=Leuresthes tenuis TaxID=355514 RepID=UPI003B500F78
MEIVVMEVDELDPRTLELKKYKRMVKSHNENTSESSYGTFPSANETSRIMRQFENSPYFLDPKKRAVVVLTRLPECTINVLQPPTPQQFNSEAESPGSSDSDMLWEPGDDSGDSDFSVADNKQKTLKPKKSDLIETPPSAKTTPPSAKTTPPSAKATPPPSTCRNEKSVTERGPIVVSAAFAHSSAETTKIRPVFPEVELKLDMTVLARRRAMRWQRGKIVEIVTKEDGRLKYKVSFLEKGKSLVSGHHIASDFTPKLEQLHVGARVVIKSSDDTHCFIPGILAELPSRKNRLRFLVFLDDHTPLYVGLPSLHLVCRPLEDTIDDIPDGPHKCFMKQYLMNWPYPHLTHYKVGQSINVEVNGAQQKCEVVVVDCSLIQVVFQDNPNKEWIHRGSLRLEHMAKFLKLKGLQEKKANTEPK